MAVNLSRIDRLYRHYDVAVADAAGTAVVISGVDFALLTPRHTPDADTTWTAGSYAAGVATVLLAGPDADGTDALVVPSAGADLWRRITDDPEVSAARVERVSVS